MRYLLSRVVALFLIPCLMAGPCLSSTLDDHLSLINRNADPSISHHFASEAFAPVAVPFIHPFRFATWTLVLAAFLGSANLQYAQKPPKGETSASARGSEMSESHRKLIIQQLIATQIEFEKVSRDYSLFQLDRAEMHSRHDNDGLVLALGAQYSVLQDRIDALKKELKTGGMSKGTINDVLAAGKANAEASAKLRSNKTGLAERSASGPQPSQSPASTSRGAVHAPTSESATAPEFYPADPEQFLLGSASMTDLSKMAPMMTYIAQVVIRYADQEGIGKLIHLFEVINEQESSADKNDMRSYIGVLMLSQIAIAPADPTATDFYSKSLPEFIQKNLVYLNALKPGVKVGVDPNILNRTVLPMALSNLAKGVWKEAPTNLALLSTEWAITAYGRGPNIEGKAEYLKALQNGLPAMGPFTDLLSPIIKQAALLAQTPNSALLSKEYYIKALGGTVNEASTAVQQLANNILHAQGIPQQQKAIEDLLQQLVSVNLIERLRTNAGFKDDIQTQASIGVIAASLVSGSVLPNDFAANVVRNCLLSLFNADTTFRVGFRDAQPLFKLTLQLLAMHVGVNGDSLGNAFEENFKKVAEVDLVDDFSKINRFHAVLEMAAAVPTERLTDRILTSLAFFLVHSALPNPDGDNFQITLNLLMRKSKLPFAARKIFEEAPSVKTPRELSADTRDERLHTIWYLLNNNEDLWQKPQPHGALLLNPLGPKNSKNKQSRSLRVAV